MADKSLTARVNKIRKLVDSLGPALLFRKLHGILSALEMQVEDGTYERQAVTRLCEAFLATRELYNIPEPACTELETAVCSVVTLVEDGR